jgi:ABC-2 type transport system permease protein
MQFRLREFLFKIWVLIWKDIKLILSYRFNLLLELVWLLGLTFGFYFLAKTFENYIPPMLMVYGGYFPYVLIGYSFSGLQGAGMSAPSGSIRDEQVQGTLESLMANGASPMAIATSGTITNYLVVLLHAFILIIMGFILIGSSITLNGILGAIIILSISCIAYFGLGLLGSVFILIYKRGNPVIMAYTGLSFLVSGIYFPYEILPLPLRIFSKVIPLTYTLDGLRKSILLGLGISHIYKEIIVLSIMALVFLPLGILALKLATNKAKRDASLTQY